MGNSNSTSQNGLQVPTATPARHRTISKQRSGCFPGIKIGSNPPPECQLSDLGSGDSTMTLNEKAHFHPQHQPHQHQHHRRAPDNANTENSIPRDAALTTHAYTHQITFQEDGAAEAYRVFIKAFPEYQLTWILDTLRRSDYSRLDNKNGGETYVDYMGGALYPESLIRVHASFLNHSVLGNTHSLSNSSKMSAQLTKEAREAVLSFFKAPSGYTVVFTANATGALKLVGESFPFGAGSSFVLGTDSHNSVHGIREYAARQGAKVCYIGSTPTGGFELESAESVLGHNRPHEEESPCLFALTAQSNISNVKNPLSTIEYAASLGYYTLLDAAALVPTSAFSLSDTPVDAMAVSFYKMFGFPTGVGALVVKESFLEMLKRPWFSGGNVDVVQVPGTVVTRTAQVQERFEDGTINYLNLPAITDGLRFLSAYLPFLPLRLSSLLLFLTSSLSRLQHQSTGGPVVKILSRLPTRRIKSVGEQAETGSIVSLLFLAPSGEPLPNSFIDYVASQQRISLRTGCMCNPGGAAALLGITDQMCALYPDVTLKDFEGIVGRELGVVRISLGLGSTFEDCWRVVRLGATIGDEERRGKLWQRWVEEVGVGRAL